MKTKEILQARLDNINEAIGTKYILDYNSAYKGWNLYQMEGNIVCPGKLGTFSLLSSSAMLAYLDGILGGLRVANEKKEV